MDKQLIRILGKSFFFLTMLLIFIMRIFTLLFDGICLPGLFSLGFPCCVFGVELNVGTLSCSWGSNPLGASFDVDDDRLSNPLVDSRIASSNSNSKCCMGN